MLRGLSAAVLLLLAITLPVFASQAVTAQTLSTLVVSEVQTSGVDELGAEDGRAEFIELHNQSAEDIGVTDWKIEYFSSSRTDAADPAATPTREVARLTGSVEGYGYVLLSYVDYIDNADVYFGQDSTATSGLLARTGGHLRIIDGTGQLTDRVGWGTAKIPETKAVSEIPEGYSAQRLRDATYPDLLIDTDNNYLDFAAASATLSPQGGSLYLPDLTEEEPPVAEEPDPTTCDGIIITEILPNAAGNDGGKEFIELYNPTSKPIELAGCKLQTSANAKQFGFADGTILQSHEYRAFYDTETGLTLPNSTGGEVWLVSSTTELAVQYPANQKDDHAWALIANIWQDTSTATPDGANMLPFVEDQEEAGDEELEPAPCPEGKYRNPETSRCRNLITSATYAPCKSGQQRNPTTNRCRSIVTAVATLTPCKSGQERNPQTNRCRSVAGASTELAACREGYKRNLTTNRCRKIISVNAASPSVGALPAGETSGRLNYLLIIFGSLVVLGYAAYEYRQDLSNLLGRFRSRNQNKHSTK